MKVEIQMLFLFTCRRKTCLCLAFWALCVALFIFSAYNIVMIKCAFTAVGLVSEGNKVIFESLPLKTSVLLT